MKTTGDTSFISGGGSGIGQGLAGGLHPFGSKAIIAGRRIERLQADPEDNPGTSAVELKVRNAVDIQSIPTRPFADHPSFKVLINNAGIMLLDDFAHPNDAGVLAAKIKTNLSGRIRTSAALLVHLKSVPDSAVINVSPVLAFVTMAAMAIYSAAKAALRSYSSSQRYRLRITGERVIHLAPRRAQNELLKNSEEERARPLDAFTDVAIIFLRTDAEESLVGPASPMRSSRGAHEYAIKRRQ